MQERRKYIRFNTEGGVSLKSKQDPSRTIKADLFNISFEGFSVDTPERIEVGTQIQFELFINLWEEPVPGEGRIKYIQEVKVPRQVFRMGVEFISVDRQAIQYIVSRIQAEICAQARKKDTVRRKP